MQETEEKTKMNCYDWVYMGKESYGSRKASRRPPTLGIKYFDALGRIYEEMMGRKMYYTREPLVEAFEVPLEFEVYARIVKDSEGNDIQVFVKEDKGRGLRRDSSFYWDGYWEVFETKGETEATLRNSLGITTSSIRDNEGKLQEKTIKDKDGNLIVNDRYVWKNGLLIKELSLNGTRTYHYGKNPYDDTVKVEPSDEGHYFHKGYDGSVGIIPRKGDANYEKFLADPYGIWTIEDELKILSRTYGQYDSVKTFYLLDGIPKPSYRNPSITDICVVKRKSMVCPELGPNKERNHGGSDIELFIKSKCIYDCEKYKIQVESRIWGGMWIQQSTLLFEPLSASYRRMCRTEGFLLETYYHEAQHFENAMYRRRLYTTVYMPQTPFHSFEECEKNRFDGEDYIFKLWNLWKVAEYNHNNHDSPQAIHRATMEEECNEIP